MAKTINEKNELANVIFEILSIQGRNPIYRGNSALEFFTTNHGQGVKTHRIRTYGEVQRLRRMIEMSSKGACKYCTADCTSECDGNGRQS